MSLIIDITYSYRFKGKKEIIHFKLDNVDYSDVVKGFSFQHEHHQDISVGMYGVKTLYKRRKIADSCNLILEQPVGEVLNYGSIVVVFKYRNRLIEIAGEFESNSSKSNILIVRDMKLFEYKGQEKIKFI